MISYLPMELQVSMVGGFMCTMTFVTSIGAVAYCAYHTLVGTYADIPVVSEAGEGLAHAAEIGHGLARDRPPRGLLGGGE